MLIPLLIPLLAIREIIFVTYNMKRSHAPHNLDFSDFFFWSLLQPECYGLTSIELNFLFLMLIICGELTSLPWAKFTRLFFNKWGQ